jgi:ribosomal protein L37E
METCRNCGQKTLATLDWACPWCGFPLKKGKRLEVTYSQAVKLRRLPEAEYMEPWEEDLQPGPVAYILPDEGQESVRPSPDEPSDEPLLVSEDEEEFRVMEADAGTSREEYSYSEDESGKHTVIEGNKETLAEEETSTWEELMESVPGVFGVGQTSEIPQGYQACGQEAACEEPDQQASMEKPVEEMPEEPDAADEEAQNQELSTHMAEPAPKEVEHFYEPEPEMAAAIDITIEELMESYQQDDEAADKCYNDKILALTGVVALANIRDDRDFQYITVTGKDQNIFRSIKCVFNTDKAFQLKGLERGQTVVIMGRFRGSLTSMSLVDCSVI